KRGRLLSWLALQFPPTPPSHDVDGAALHQLRVNRTPSHGPLPAKLRDTAYANAPRRCAVLKRRARGASPFLRKKPPRPRQPRGEPSVPQTTQLCPRPCIPARVDRALVATVMPPIRVRTVHPCSSSGSARQTFRLPKARPGLIAPGRCRH